MGTTTVLRVQADIVWDPCHLVGHDDYGDEIEEGRWVLTIEAPGAEVCRVSKLIQPLVGFADRWGRDRGVWVDLRLLTPLGGPR